MWVNNLRKVATQWNSGATRDSNRGQRVRIPSALTTKPLSHNVLLICFSRMSTYQSRCIDWCFCRVVNIAILYCNTQYCQYRFQYCQSRPIAILFEKIYLYWYYCEGAKYWYSLGNTAKVLVFCIAILVKNLYWYWYWQHFFQAVLVLVLPILCKRIVNNPVFLWHTISNCTCEI